MPLLTPLIAGVIIVPAIPVIHININTIYCNKKKLTVYFFYVKIIKESEGYTWQLKLD